MFSELFHTFWRYSLLINSSRNIYFPAPSHGNGYIALPQEKPYYFDDILLINALRKVCFWQSPILWQWIYLHCHKRNSTTLQVGSLSRGSALFGNQVWRFKSFPKVFLTEPLQCARYIKAHLRGPVSHVLPLQSLGSEWDIGRDLVASLQIFQFKASSAGEGKWSHARSGLDRQHLLQHQCVSAREASGASGHPLLQYQHVILAGASRLASAGLDKNRLFQYYHIWAHFRMWPDMESGSVVKRYLMLLVIN